MDVWDQFAAEAELFVQWAEGGIRDGHDGATEALQRIARLYGAGVCLPCPESGDIQEEPYRVTRDEWQTVYARSAKLQLDFYNTCEPILDVEPEYMVGSLSDDIADIYRDVCTGLRLFRAGHRNEAAWEWEFNFRAHWGTHAADAIRVLHHHVFG
ncbi:DUF5063 domain-containing protein [Anatilimnocola floriformis]|uniref:DUF5063 domain-containing protein n=1 Tax=Anatilimnocola floriformis TaxID=2948575 RepID=UPI0020C224FD|nr:DUF5063 domain-containing protein [Anatilimnocola floriformis]